MNDLLKPSELAGCVCDRRSFAAEDHASDCPVKSASVWDERHARREAETGEPRINISIRGEGPWPGKVRCPGCALWVTNVADHIHGGFCAKRDRAGREITAPAFAVGQAVRTRDGRAARVVCVDAKEPYPVVALIPVSETGPHGPLTGEWPAKYRANGRYNADIECGEDLLPAPRRAVVWVRGRWLPDGQPYVWASTEGLSGKSGENDETADYQIRVEIEEGRFDE